MKFKMAFFVLLVFIGVIYSAYGNESEINSCIQFIKSYGWEVLPNPTERVDVTIPKVFDRVYENYNELQKSAGLGLMPYRSKSGVRYSFVVTNYPEYTGETVYANIILIDGKAIAGDIMTVSLNGFMHALNKYSP